MNSFNPIWEAIDRALPQIRKPSRYLGNEKNSVKKDWAHIDLKIALCYPDAYEIGMSNIGIQILYHLLNRHPHMLAERVFAPWLDFEQFLRQEKLPLVSLESKVPLRQFDVLGISLPYELTYTNILTLLDLAGLSFYAKDRGEKDPLVIGGGNNAFNPEPVADFFDALLIGDGEEACLEMMEVIRHHRHRETKQKLLGRLASIRGVYIPSFFKFYYKNGGTISHVEPLLEGYKGVQKRSVSDLDTSYYPKKPIIPHTKIIHDRVGVEVQRGCVRGCRFCQAGYIYRPERQRSPDTVKEIVRHQIRNTGQDAVSLVSLSIGDYDCISQLMKDLMDEHLSRHVGISIPSTRVEQLTPAMMEEIKRVRKTGFTIAPEAATERMRRVINKGNSEGDLLTTVNEVFKNGWRLLKFYFLVGLPTETDEDVSAIAALGLKSLRTGEVHSRNIEINLGISLFVPKPFTPFQWEPQISIEEMYRRLNLIKRSLKARKLRLKPHIPEMSYLEGVFSRGDRRLAPAIISAWKKGCRFYEWEECAAFEKWKEAFIECGIDTSFYVERPREKDEILPWDHLFVEMKKEWLWKEREAAFKESFTHDCSVESCTTCGVCDYKDVRNRAYEHPLYDEEGRLFKKKTTTEIRHQDPSCPSPAIAVDFPQASPASSLDPPGQSFLCQFSKKGPARLFGFLEFVEHVRRAVARAEIPVRFSEGFHPHPRIKFGDALKVGQEIEEALFIIEIEGPMEPTILIEHLNGQFPEGIRLHSVRPIDSFLSLQKLMSRSMAAHDISI